MKRVISIVACVVIAGGASVSATQIPPPGAASPQGPPAPIVNAPPAPMVIGPAAPVPPEVAIPRPTPEELVLVNDAVKKFVEASEPSVRPVLKKFEPLLLLQPPRRNVAATFTQTTQRRGARHLGFVEIAKQGNIDVLLHGDSITDWWVQGPENKAMFDKYFAGIRTANFAISGDTTQGVLWGLRNGEGQGFQPKAVMLMIGTNNNASNTAPEIAEGIGAVVLELRTNFPDAKILLLAVFPRSVPGDPIRDKIMEVNRIIARLDDQKHVFYMDIGAAFLDDQGFFLPETFRPDNLHPIAKGYEIWGEAVKAKLAELLIPTGQESGRTRERTEKGLYLLRVVEPGYDVTIKETERGPGYSVLDVNGLVPTVTAAGTVLFRAIYDIARERGFEHTFTLPPPGGPAPGPGARGTDGRRLALVSKVFMTKDPKAVLKDLLGPDYSPEAQQLFDLRGYMSVAQMAVLFGGR